MKYVKIIDGIFANPIYFKVKDTKYLKDHVELTGNTITISKENDIIYCTNDNVVYAFEDVTNSTAKEYNDTIKKAIKILSNEIH